MICYHCTRVARPGFRTCPVHEHNAVPGGYGPCGTRTYRTQPTVVVVEQNYGSSFEDVVIADIVADAIADAVTDFGGDW